MPRWRCRRIRLGGHSSTPPPLPPIDPNDPRAVPGTHIYRIYVQSMQDMMPVVDSWPPDIREWVHKYDLNAEEILLLSAYDIDTIRKKLRQVAIDEGYEK